MNEHMEAVREQILATAVVGIPNKDGDTPLPLAAANDHTETTVAVLQLGANVTEEEQSLGGYATAVRAAKGGHANTDSGFLNVEANIKEHNSDGDTPLLLALKRGHFLYSPRSDPGQCTS